jgi:single-strand DNA-binding protein
MFNRIVLIGRLTRDPEVRTTTTGKNYATFSIAVDKGRKPTDPNEPTADFFNVKVWGQTVDYVSNYLTKGRLIAVDGRIEGRKYIDKEGIQREIWEVTADNVKGLDRVRDDSDGGGHNAPAPRRSPASVAPSPAEYDPFAED